MIKSLTLTNFMQHENLSVLFTEGINAIRGANEKGKSTLITAIMYLQHGARALPESVDEVVTWGKPTNSMRVDSVIEIDGHDYTCYRSPTGAEVKGNGITVSGQSHVTAFFTKIFEADLKIAKEVIISDQDSIRTATENGGGTLIETLAETKLIDELITKMQTFYSTGNTKALDLQVGELEQSLGAEPTIDLEPYDQAIEQAQATLDEISDEVLSQGAELEPLRKSADDARATLASFKSLSTRLEMLRSDAAKLETEVNSFVPGEFIDTAPFTKAVEEEALQVKIKKDFDTFNAISKLPPEGTLDEFVATKQRVTSELEQATSKLQDLKSKRKTQAGSLINSTGKCNVCGSILQSKEDIDKHNQQVLEKVAELDGQIEPLVIEVGKLTNLSNRLSLLEKQDRQTYSAVTAINSAYIAIDVNQWPSQYKWVGPTDFTSTGAAAKLVEVNAANSRIGRANEDHARKVERLASIQNEIINTNFGDVKVDELEAVIAKFEALKATMRDLDTAFHTAKDALSKAQNAKTLDVQLFNQKHQHWLDKKEQLAKLKDTLNEMVDNNAIIKKLREARPIVMQELWETVLSLVSEAFSLVRGVPSVVTRDDSGFLIDGKRLSLFSGSTKDSLGFVIRPTLQKVFMPTVDFAIFDEPTRGMDNERQANLLAEISRLNIRQTIVVTHSPVIDVYANNLIEL